jgi:type III secretion protein T
MEALFALEGLGDRAMLVALASTRFAVAFLLLPVFATDTVPALVRNALFVAFGIVTLAVQPLPVVGDWRVADWLQRFGREALLGVGFGVLVGAVLWAFEAAGEIIDTKVGATLAQVIDPLSGHQTSLSGALLSRLAMVLFMAGGGFLVLVGVLVQSFTLWPLSKPGFVLPPDSVRLFEQALGDFALLSLLLAGPGLLMLYLIDAALGMVNRFAPQLNLISISMSLKAVAATLVWALLFMPLVDAIGGHIERVLAGALPALRVWLP